MINVIFSFVISILSCNQSYAADNKKIQNQSSVSNLHNLTENSIIKEEKLGKIDNKNVNISHGYIQSKSFDEENSYKRTNFEISIAEQKPILYEDKKLLEALVAYEIGQIELAVHLYKQVLAKSADNYNALFGLASIYQKEKRIDEARSLYTKILNLHPNDEATLNNFIELSGGEAPEKTIEELEKLAIHKPNFSLIFAQIATIYNNTKNYDKAIEYLYKALNLSPENLNYRYNLAIIYDQIGSYDKAFYLYNQILKTNFTNQEYNINYDQIIQRVKYLYNR